LTRHINLALEEVHIADLEGRSLAEAQTTEGT
jgi:hypothetical protein